MSRMVEAALELDKYSIDYLVEFPPKEAREFVSRAEAYNGFTQEGLVELIDEIGNLIPLKDYGPDNPNTGQPHHRFRIGNEGSRVIYLEIYETYMPKDYGKYELLFENLKNLGYAARADEVDEVDPGIFTRGIRYWWD